MLRGVHQEIYSQLVSSLSLFSGPSGCLSCSLSMQMNQSKLNWVAQKEVVRGLDGTFSTPGDHIKTPENVF